MRCLDCGAWNGENRRRRCPNCGTVLEPVPDHLARAIAASLLCGVIGLVSLYLSVRTNRSLAAGDYPGAREHSWLAKAWANAALWFTLTASLSFGVVALLGATGGGP